MDSDFPVLENIDLHNYFKEQIVFLYFNLTRKSEAADIETLRHHFSQVLELLVDNGKWSGSAEYLKIIYKMIAQTRDIHEGKGEHELSYMLIYAFYQYYPIIATELLYKFVIGDCENPVPYGSWRDIKYLCKYTREHSLEKENDELIVLCVKILNNQLKRDTESWKFSVHAGSRDHISNVAKWIPRENKQFHWLFKLLVIDWSNRFSKWKMPVSEEHPSYVAAFTKAKQQYRKIFSFLNKKLDTTEIKQCSQKVDEINPRHVSCYTLMKQKLTFLENQCCLSTFKSYFEEKFFEREPAQLTPFDNYFVNFPISYFVKEAIRISKLNSDENNDTGFQYDILNKQWELLCKSIPNNYFKYLLPIIDVSLKMQENDAESFYFAIGYAILISSKSFFYKRILAVDHEYSWINLDDHSNFISMVENILLQISSHQNTCFSCENSLEIILQGLSTVEEPSPFLNKMRLVFFSNSFDDPRFFTYLENISCKNIILWNLSKKIVNIPLFVNKNVVLLSGFSNVLLKNITTFNNGNCIKIGDVNAKGHNDISNQFINNILNNKRYNQLS